MTATDTTEYYENEEEETTLKNFPIIAGKWALSVIHRALRRGVLIYVNPLKVFKEVSDSPDILPPLLLLLSSLLFSTSMVFALIEDVRVFINNNVREIIPYSEYSTIYILKGMGLFGIWVLSFIVFWFLMYLMKAGTNSYAIFSASGYLYSSMLPIYALLFIMYKLVASLTPTITVTYYSNMAISFSLETLELSTIPLKIIMASNKLGLSLYMLIAILSWFSVLWGVFLSIFLIKEVGKTSWVRSAIGGVVAALPLVLVRSVLQSLGFF